MWPRSPPVCVCRKLVALPSFCVPSVMRTLPLARLAIFCAGGALAGAADATSPVDATQRNQAFGVSTTVAPEKQSPADRANSRVMEQKYETGTVEKKLAPVGGERAAIELREARDKTVIEKDSSRPEAKERQLSSYNQRPATISTGADTRKPPTVTRYQESLTAASASNMARFPALDRATSAKINRFVFRKNPAETAGVTEGRAVTPAAGGSAIRP